MKKGKFAKVKQFLEENKKPLMVIGGVLLTGGLAILGWKTSGQGDPEPYTTEWLKGLSEEELPEEHEKARLAMRDARDNWVLACKMDFWRRNIAAEIQRRKSGGTDNYISPPPREDGYNLYRPD